MTNPKLTLFLLALSLFASAAVAAEQDFSKVEIKVTTVAGKEVKPAVREALPVVTFSERASVHVNGEDIRAIHFPHGHTDGDSVIFFPKANVVHMGDDFVTYGFPYVDVKSGGSI